MSVIIKRPKDVNIGSEKSCAMLGVPSKVHTPVEEIKLQRRIKEAADNEGFVFSLS